MNTIKRNWRITNRCYKWWGIFLIVVLFIAAVALMLGVLTLEVDLDLGIVDDVTNPMFALCFFALLLFAVSYPIMFVLILPVTFLLSFRKTTPKN